MKKYHHGFGPNTLMQRTFCGMMWQLCREPIEDAKVKKFKKEFTSKGKQQPSKIKGLNIFIQEYMQDYAMEAHNEPGQTRARRNLFGEAARLYKRLPPHLRAPYLQTAQVRRFEKQQVLDTAAKETKEALEEREAEILQKLLREAGLGRVNGCRLDPLALQTLVRRCTEATMTETHVEALREKKPSPCLAPRTRT